MNFLLGKGPYTVWRIIEGFGHLFCRFEVYPFFLFGKRARALYSQESKRNPCHLTRQGLVLRRSELMKGEGAESRFLNTRNTRTRQPSGNVLDKNLKD
jgi:hypothetical protein